MSVETVRSDIDAAIQQIKIASAAATIRLALQTYREVYFGTPMYGLTTKDKRARRYELERIDWLLNTVFPEEVSDG